MIDGARLKSLREAAELSAAKLGEIAGVSASAILHTERGFDKLGLKSIALVADRLGVTIDELIKKES